MFDWLQESAIYIIDIVFGLYSFIVLLRFLFQCARVNFYNPISQFLLSVTNPILIPIRRVIPGFFGLDIPALLLLFLVNIIHIVTKVAILAPSKLQPIIIPSITISALVNIASLALNIYFFSLIIMIIFSWLTAFGVINPYNQYPVISVIEQLLEPLTSRARKILPPISGLDLSPILIIALIHILQRGIMRLEIFLASF